jgi:hypothetical protein
MKLKVARRTENTRKRVDERDRENDSREIFSCKSIKFFSMTTAFTSQTKKADSLGFNALVNAARESFSSFRLPSGWQKAKQISCCILSLLFGHEQGKREGKQKASFYRFETNMGRQARVSKHALHSRRMCCRSHGNFIDTQ